MSKLILKLAAFYRIASNVTEIGPNKIRLTNIIYAWRDIFCSIDGIDSYNISVNFIKVASYSHDPKGFKLKSPFYAICSIGLELGETGSYSVAFWAEINDGTENKIKIAEYSVTCK